jgi:hypothetical protein
MAAHGCDRDVRKSPRNRGECSSGSGLEDPISERATERLIDDDSPDPRVEPSHRRVHSQPVSRRRRGSRGSAYLAIHAAGLETYADGLVTRPTDGTGRFVADEIREGLVALDGHVGLW